MAKDFIVGVFDDEYHLVDAIKELKAGGFTPYDVYTPYPVHEILTTTGRKSRIPTAAWFYGVIGASMILAFLYYTSVISWPLNYGGKPANSFPSFITVTIVLTILFVTLASLATFSFASKLYPGMKSNVIDTRATNDKFIVVFEKDGLLADEYNRLSTMMNTLGAKEIYEKLAA